MIWTLKALCTILVSSQSYLTISSGKQLLMVLMYSWRALPGSALISCTFLSPPLVTKSLLAAGSWGTTLLNWPTTCLRIFGGASWRRGSRAGRWTHFCRMFFSAFFACQNETIFIYLYIKSEIFLYLPHFFTVTWKWTILTLDISTHPQWNETLYINKKVKPLLICSFFLLSHENGPFWHWTTPTHPQWQFNPLLSTSDDLNAISDSLVSWNVDLLRL